VAYTFLDLAKDVLQETKRPLSAEEIWEEGLRLNFAQKVGSSGKTPWRSIGAQIYTEIKTKKRKRFIQVSRRPACFGLPSIDYSEQEKIVTEKHESDPIPKFKERDLHPLLTAFVRSSAHFKCYTKTIYHEKSARAVKGYNEWLHPDLVGVYFPFDEYQSTTLQLSKALNVNRYRLFSFELKNKISFSTLRESYFQALSNSIWAHEGYLVTLELSDDSELLDEIRRLNNSFGIGLIQLNAENIEQSEILFPARVNEKLDWDTIDRLAEENRDFQELLGDLLEDITLGKVKSNYDKVFDTEALREYALNKGITK